MLHMPITVTTSMTLLTISFLFTCFAAVANAAPLSVRDVFAPPITSPTASTVWNTGDKQTVTWDASTPPNQVTNWMGTLVLGFLEDGSDNEHLMLDNPLAQGFNLSDAKVDITVPDVPSRKDYIVVLIGDSGNASPRFTINNQNGAPAPGTPTSAPAAPPGTAAPSTAASSSGGASTSGPEIPSPRPASPPATPPGSSAQSSSAPADPAETPATTPASSSTSSTASSAATSPAATQGSSTSGALPAFVLRGASYGIPLLLSLLLL